MSGIVETTERGIVPCVPIREGETFPARGSRVRVVRTSEYIYRASRLAGSRGRKRMGNETHLEEQIARTVREVSPRGRLIQFCRRPLPTLSTSTKGRRGRRKDRKGDQPRRGGKKGETTHIFQVSLDEEPPVSPDESVGFGKELLRRRARCQSRLPLPPLAAPASRLRNFRGCRLRLVLALPCPFSLLCELRLGEGVGDRLSAVVHEVEGRERGRLDDGFDGCLGPFVGRESCRRLCRGI
jgi:hypothetical protein